MEVKILENMYFMGRLYKMGYIYEIPEELHRHIKEKIEPIETAIDYTALTKKEIAVILDKQGIEYSMKSKKDELISLLGGE